MARRANGEGTIYRLPNGYWRGTVSVRVGGKLVRKSVVRVKRAEVVAAMETLKEKLGGFTVSDGSATVEKFLTQWVENYVKNEFREHTYRSYERAVRLHILPRIGHLKLSKLTPLHIEEFKRSMAESGVKPRAAQSAFEVLYGAMKYAVHPLRVLAVSPCAGVNAPKHTSRKMKPFEASEAKSIIEDAAGTRWAAFYAVAFGCGLRVGELFGLKWSDVDWTESRLHVQRQAIDSGGRTSLAVPKTKHSIRSVNIPATVLRELREHRGIQFRQGLAADDCLIFPNLSGGIMSRSNFYHDEWKPRLVRCCLEHRGIHHTRHTYATLALLAGVPAPVVSKELGHSNPSITHQIYSHCLPSAEKGAAVAMDRLLG